MITTLYLYKVKPFHALKKCDRCTHLLKNPQLSPHLNNRFHLLFQHLSFDDDHRERSGERMLKTELQAKEHHDQLAIPAQGLRMATYVLCIVISGSVRYTFFHASTQTLPPPGSLEEPNPHMLNPLFKSKTLGPVHSHPCSSKGIKQPTDERNSSSPSLYMLADALPSTIPLHTPSSPKCFSFTILTGCETIFQNQFFELEKWEGCTNSCKETDILSQPWPHLLCSRWFCLIQAEFTENSGVPSIALDSNDRKSKVQSHRRQLLAHYECPSKCEFPLPSFSCIAQKDFSSDGEMRLAPAPTILLNKSAKYYYI